MSHSPRLPLAVVALCALVALPATVAAETLVPAGNMNASQVWTVAGSPYVITGDVTVTSGYTLTVEAGAIVEFATGDTQGSGEDNTRTELRIEGALVTQGTSMLPTVFRSRQASPATGDYYGVVVTGSGTASVAHSNFAHGQRCLHLKGTGAVQVTGGLFDLCGYGVWVAAGAPQMTGATVARSTSYGVHVSAGSLTASDLLVRDNQSYGVYSTSASVSLTGSVIRRNSSYGIYGYNSTVASTVTLRHNTIVENGGAGGLGAYFYRSSGTFNVTFQDNAVVNNGGYGVYVSGSPSMTIDHNLVWGHTSADYYNVSAGTGSLAENPLFVDLAGGDLRPTSRSGLRLAASDGGDIGAVAYDGFATTVLAGHLFVDTLLTAAASPHTVVGDLTVHPGVTLTIEPGSTVRFAALTDLMRAGLDTTRTELIVRGTLVADGTASSGILLESAAGTPARGDWYGVHLMPGSASSLLDYATVRHAQYAVHSEAPAGTVVQRSILEESSSYGVYVSAGAASFAELQIRRNGSHGFYVASASPTLTRSRVFDNASYGAYVYNSTVASTVAITHSTFVANGGAGGLGIYLYRSSGTLSVTVQDNLVTANGGYGVYVSGSPSVAIDHNLVWGHTTADYYNVSGGTGAVTENPLLVDLAGRDLRITSRSPARLHASDGGDIGALAYDGAPTVGWQGHLYENTSWLAAGGPYAVLGDLTVEPGVTLTIGPGAVVTFAAHTDSMGGNLDTTRTELRVLGRLVVDGDPGNLVTLKSAAGTPAPGDWYGVHLTPTSSSSAIEYALVRHAQYGVHSQADNLNSVSRTEVADAQSYGVYVAQGSAVFDGMQIHHCGSHGVYVSSASPTLNNLVVYSNASYGVYLYNSTTANTVVVNHLTAWGNGGSGGLGVYIYRSSGTHNVTVENSIIAENGAYGIYVSGSPSVTLRNNDLWNHTTANYYNVSAGTGSIVANPQFVDTSLGNFHLLGTSQAIDAADPGTALAVDCEGQTRPIDGNGAGGAQPDMGAYEYNPSANKWPIADAGPDKVAEAGKSISFDGSGSSDPDGTIASWHWDFGDGNTATGQSVAHTFTGGTDRTVTLTVVDNSGAIDVDTAFVKVNLPPTAEAGPAHYADPGEIVTFSGLGSTDSDGTIVLYRWDFGDSGQGSGASVTHQYAVGGDYTVTLTVTDNDGSTNQDTTVVHVAGGGDGSPPTITHTPVADGRPMGAAVTVTAEISDPSGVASAVLFYRPSGGIFSNVVMTHGAGSSYSAQIPAGAVVPPFVDYYLQATDGATPANAGTSPVGAPGSLHRFTVVDGVAPTIDHTPVSSPQVAGQPVRVTATVTDNLDVASATVYYRAVGGTGFQALALTNTAGDTWEADIPGAAVVVAGVEYYLQAQDVASPANSATHPAGAPTSLHSFTVTTTDNTAPVVNHTPIGSPQPPNVAVSVVATITDSSGVASATLRYRTGAGTWQSAAMAAGGGNSFSAQIPAGAVLVGHVSYYLEAVDGSAQANHALLPSGGETSPFTFTVAVVDTQGPAITHTPIADGQPAGAAIPVAATVTDPSGVGAVTLYFRTTGTTTYLSLPMTSGGGDAYAATIPAGLVVAPGLDYYLEAVDASSAQNPSRLPTGGGTSPYHFTVTTVDAAGPSITHVPLADGQPAGTAIPVTALVTDPSGVASVTLHFRQQGTGTFLAASMTAAGDTYSATIPAAIVQLPGIEYYLEAVDGAAAANVATLPAAGSNAPFVFSVAAVDAAGPSIVHTPVADDRPAGVAVAVQAVVTDPSGVADVRLYFRASGAGAFLSTPMAVASGDTYGAEIPAELIRPPGVDYYLEAVDAAAAANASLDPPTAPTAFHTFSVATPPDTAAPRIVHTPIGDGMPAGQVVDVEAVVTDASGLAEVTLNYRVAGEAAFRALPMTAGSGDRYTAQIPAADVTPAGVEYYFHAVDASAAANAAVDPADAPASLYRFTPGSATPPADGGCSCASAGGASGPGGALLLLPLLLGLALRRRRVSGS
jgi:MYXO-CTERM domain-containing protein